MSCFITCHVILYDMFKTEPNRTCYITCVMLCDISSKQNRTEHVMLYNKREHVLMCHIT